MTKRLRPDQFPPWYDGQSINEAAFCREFLASHKLLYTENSFFTPEGRMTDEALLKTEIYQLIESYASTSVPKKISNIIELLKITAHIDDFPPQTDRIHVANGTLFLDGHDMNSLPIKEVRAAIAYVPQDNFLFSDTIGNNIALSKDDSTREEVLRAAKLADIDENVSSFALGYDTVLGERGVTVSGGQKQRISIARALLKEAPILILDDAVSAVDVKTEQKILENLKKERQGKTTLLIAHRVSTVENLDRIVCLEEGRILDVGTHEELYARCPAYKKTVDLQQWDEQKGGEHHA